MIYDVLIIGAGIEGSATGYNLVKNESAKNVLLLEQVSLLSIQLHYRWVMHSMPLKKALKPGILSLK